tara:strand:- start:888 stop:1301 length:414 start_codon:yes stop_codon:yes gene_type:complete
MLEEIKSIKKSNSDIRSFGITIGIILIIISAFLFYYEKSSYQIFFSVAFGFIGLGIILPISLKPIYIVWMTFAVILGWIMTRVILSLLFFLIMTPTGFIARLFGKQFLELEWDDSKNSYWNYRSKTDTLKEDYEKQF